MITRVLLFLFLASYSLIQVTVCVCPSEEFIQPCSCMTVAFGTHVVCGMINSTEVLKDIFRVLSNYEIHTLLLNTLRLETEPLSATTFDGLRVNNLRFEDSIFEISSGDSPFVGLKNYLSVLDISNCHIEHLGGITFKYLINLRDVTMSFDSMDSITTNWFSDGPESVKKVLLDHNQIEHIESNAFGGLANIETISLADNRLETVTRDIFPRNATRLSWMDLSYNRLEDLPSDMFVRMPRLKRVVLTGNRLTSLPQNTWGNVWNKLDSVILKDNPIVCDNEIRWAFSERQRPRHLNGSCQLPKELTGTHLNGLTVDKLQSR